MRSKLETEEINSINVNVESKPTYPSVLAFDTDLQFSGNPFS